MLPSCIEKRLRFPVKNPLILLLALMLLYGNAQAQYFGRNKIRYHAFDFQVMHTRHFDIHYYIKDTQVINDVAKMAERWHDRYVALFGYELSGRKPIILYASHADFQQTNAISGFIDQGVQGVTEGLKDRLVMPLANSYDGTNHVIGHEMVHVFQYDMAMSMRNVGMRGMAEMPLWMVEGMAEYLSVGREDALTSQYLRDAMIRDKLPSYKDMNRRPDIYNPYHFGQAFWAYVGGKYGDKMVSRLFTTSLRKGVDDAIDSLFHMKPKELFDQWHEEIKSSYSKALEKKDPISSFGKKFFVKRKKVTTMNISPSISPNGKYVAYISQKDIFSIELFLANANTGKDIRRLTNTLTSQHFEELRFLETSGTWSPDSRKFAFAALDKGQDKLIVIDAKTGRVEKDFHLEVPSINDPSWSPDGKYIVFSGSKGGTTDLYLLEYETGNLRRLTNDRYADLQSAWSPDGRYIAFVSDRSPETDFSKLSLSPLNIYLYELSTGNISRVPAFNDKTLSSPQFSTDGRSIFFIAAPDGFNNIYRYSLDNQGIYRISNIRTGVTGITEVSPALSVARQSGKMVYSVLENNSFNLYALDSQLTSGYPYRSDSMDAGILPPFNPAAPAIVAQYMKTPLAGLPDTLTKTTTPYKPRLSLDYIGQAGIGAGYSSYGSTLMGGVTAVFSDLLGDHITGGSLQMQGTGLQDLGGELMYYNLKHRLQWGGYIVRVPFLTGYAFDATDTMYYVGELYDRFFINQVSGSLNYPFSVTKRLEFNLSYTRYSFSRQLYKYYQNGDFKKENLQVPPPQDFVQPSLAYVMDNSFFGFTSPVKGTRGRLEVQPTFGDFSFTTFLADYRHYFFFRPVTLAFRGIFEGRYGNAVNKNLLTPFYLGYPDLVRGYAFRPNDPDVNFDSEHNPIVYTRTQGNKMIVGNVEFRLPLTGTKEFGLINFPYLPTELIAFTDGGLAWDSYNPPVLKLSTSADGHVPVFSSGTGIRANLLGYIVLEVYYVYPYQRPEKGAHFDFLISAGW